MDTERWICPPATNLGDAVTSFRCCRWGRRSPTGTFSGGTAAHTALPSGQVRAHSLVPRRPSQVQQSSAHAWPPLRASGLSPHIIQLCSSVVGLLLHQASRSGNRIEAASCMMRRAAGVRGLHIPRHWGAGCRRVWSNCSQLPGPSLGTLEDARQDWCVRAGAVSHSLCVCACFQYFRKIPMNVV